MALAWPERLRATSTLNATSCSSLTRPGSSPWASMLRSEPRWSMASIENRPRGSRRSSIDVLGMGVPSGSADDDGVDGGTTGALDLQRCCGVQEGPATVGGTGRGEVVEPADLG